MGQAKTDEVVVTLNSLQSTILQSWRAANALLAHATAQPGLADEGHFSYVMPVAGVDQAQSIPLARFQRAYGMCLPSLNITLYCYCIPEKIGTRQTGRFLLSLKRPNFWQSLLHSYPLLCLDIDVSEGQCRTRVDIARRTDYVGQLNWLILLGARQQQQLRRFQPVPTTGLRQVFGVVVAGLGNIFAKHK